MNSTLSLQRTAAARTVQRRNSSIRCAANVTDVNSLPPPAVAASPPKGKAIELYIGHAKDQVKEKAEGVKGRFVVDDPAKYPERTEYVGGWAGGEQGLQDFVAAYKREIELNGAPPKVKYNKFSRQPEPIAKGSDTIYMGNGRVIQDDARRYPTRNELTGGFAGGELGLTVFKEIGDVPIAENGQGTKQNSPLITAFVLGLAATGGGLLLSTIQEVGVSVVEGGVPAANAVNATAGLGLDEKTRATLTAAILLVGVIGTVAGAQVLLDSMANKVRAGASKLAILGAFWVVVFLAAKLVLEG